MPTIHLAAITVAKALVVGACPDSEQVGIQRMAPQLAATLPRQTVATCGGRVTEMLQRSVGRIIV